MEAAMFEGAVVKTFVFMCVASAAPLIASSFVGLLISLVQSATQIQEQTVLYLGKFLAVSAVIFILSEVALAECVDYMREIFHLLVSLGITS